MPRYIVRWEMDIEADSPLEAAEKAAKINKSEHLFTIHSPKTDRKLLEEVDLAAYHESEAQP